MKTYPLPIYVQRFFTDRLTTQLAASPNTVASYRDTFRLLLNYASQRLDRTPTNLQVADVDADLVGDFLSFVETTRANSARSRNTRLSAIRSFFKHIACQEPQLLHHCQRILAMPSKRHEKRTVDYIQRNEIEALIAAPDPTTWCGRRDRTLLQLALQTGLRVSELIHLNCSDVHLAPAHMFAVWAKDAKSDPRH
jgi:integrase/recombinase XerD